MKAFTFDRRRLAMAVAWVACGMMATSLAQAAPALKFADLEGWWSAKPEYAGESSPVVLQLLEVEGKPRARLSLPAIGTYDMDLGVVSLSGHSLDTKSLSFPLEYDAERGTLNGYLPPDAVPVYRIPVEFRRGEPLVKPAAPQWRAAKPVARWSVEVGGPIWAGIERDAETGVLFVGNDAGVLHAIDAGGKVLWRFETGKPIRAKPAVVGEHVYAASDSGYLHKLDKRDGAQAWRSKIDADSAPRIPTNEDKSRWDRYGSSVVAAGERLYVASRDGNLYALDSASGKEVWRFAASDMMTATPVLYRDLVLIADFAGKVQAVDAAEGKLRWTYDAKLAVPGDLAVHGDQVFFGSRTYELVALDAATGRERWKHYYWFSWIESPPVIRDGVIYTGSSDATKVYAIDMANGSLRWQTAVPGWAWARTAVNDELVVAGTAGAGEYPGFRSGSLVALERRTGAIRWLYLEPPSAETVAAKKGWGFGAAPLIADGVVYAADLGGRVHAFAL